MPTRRWRTIEKVPCPNARDSSYIRSDLTTKLGCSQTFKVAMGFILEYLNGVWYKNIKCVRHPG